ncbi:hypothetical protein CPB83DRAFT_762971, partial [Crepidotus variabilis]
MGFAFVDDVAISVKRKDFKETHRKLKRMMEKEGGVLEWAETHNCTFGIEKFQLLDASRKLRDDPAGGGKKVPIERPVLKIRGQHITPAHSIKFLGVHINQELRWKAQGAAAIARGAGWLAQYRRIAKPTSGVAHRHMRKLYLGIAIPRMMYAADIFLTLERQSANGKRPGGAMRNKLASLHGRIANLIVGGMSSSPYDAALAHANILPFHLLVDKVRHSAAIRLATLPITHPLHIPVKEAVSNYASTHQTPLHELMKTFNIKPDRIEKILAVRYNARWVSSATTSIAKSREAALEEEKRREGDKWRIYTDRSGIEGKIGAAAVLYQNNEVKRTLRYKLGSSRLHTVFKGEGVGILLGLEL